MSTTRKIIGLVISLTIVTIVAALGGMASIQAGPTYMELVRPTWAPPASLFGPVWSALYLMIGVASWRVWRDRGFQQTKSAMILYAVQLVLNTLWTWIFFAWRQGTWAIIEIIVLWLMIVFTIIAFRRHDRIAAWLLVPYLCWVSFASALTYALWWFNPTILP